MEIIMILTLLVTCGGPLCRVARAGSGVIRCSAELGADALEKKLDGLQKELAEKRQELKK